MLGSENIPRHNLPAHVSVTTLAADYNRNVRFFRIMKQTAIIEAAIFRAKELVRPYSDFVA